MEIRIYYDDTDSGGVVYHANYLKYFERGRTEYMRQRGVDPKDMVAQGLIFVITNTELSFLAPARYGDIITVDTFIEEISGASIIFGYKVHRKGQPKPLVVGTTKVAMVNKDMKVQKFTDDFIARLKSKV
ncbi:MAG: acyl-CoA thioesterase [Planctomycetes bacterium]|nr:acyl-CoA thioesterase [Planctomycetota bacterium]